MTAGVSDTRYLIDASALVPIFVSNVTSRIIKRLIQSAPRTLIVSDIAAGEFASVVSRYVRMRELSAAEGSKMLSTFDAWRPSNSVGVATEAADFRVADSFVRRFELKLKLPDALYLAVAQRLDVALLTFDETQAEAAGVLGLSLASV